MPNNRDVQNRFKRSGFERISKPDTELPLAPTSVSGISSEELGDWVSVYNAWREYTEDLLVREKMKLGVLKDRYDYKYKLLWMRTNKTSTVKDKEITVEITPEIRQLEEEVLEAELFAEALGAKVESYNNTLAMLSREITRRTSGRF